MCQVDVYIPPHSQGRVVVSTAGERYRACEYSRKASHFSLCLAATLTIFAIQTTSRCCCRSAEPIFAVV
jgi:hypothetical protein